MTNSTAVTKASEAVVPVDPEQTLKACKALVAHIKKSAAEPRQDGKQNLLADEETTVAETPVWLTLTTKKHIHDSNRTSKSPCPALSLAASPNGAQQLAAGGEGILRERHGVYDSAAEACANNSQVFNQERSLSLTHSTPATSSACA